MKSTAMQVIPSTPHLTGAASRKGGCEPRPQVLITALTQNHTGNGQCLRQVQGHATSPGVQSWRLLGGSQLDQEMFGQRGRQLSLAAERRRGARHASQLEWTRCGFRCLRRWAQQGGPGGQENGAGKLLPRGLAQQDPADDATGTEQGLAQARDGTEQRGREDAAGQSLGGGSGQLSSQGLLQGQRAGSAPPQSQPPVGERAGGSKPPLGTLMALLAL